MLDENTTRLDHIGHCKTASGTNWSKRWDPPFEVLDVGVDEAASKHVEQIREDLRGLRLALHFKL